MKNIKHLIVGFLVGIFSFIGGINSFTIANAANKNISSGIYECENNVKHDSEVGMSMARTYTNKKMKIEVYKDIVYFNIGFSGAEYMKNFRILINGKEAPIKNIKNDKKNNTVTLKVAGANINSKIEAKIYVEPMGRDVKFGVIPNLETMKLIKKIDEPKSKEDKNDSKENKSNLKEEKKQLSDNKNKANETEKNKVKEEKKEFENKVDNNEKMESKNIKLEDNKALKSKDTQVNKSNSKVKYGVAFGGLILALIIGGGVIKKFKK